MDGETKENIYDSGTMDYFHVLPEGCIAKTLSFTSPLDACRLSCVSPIFRSAAESDAVWELFLPDDYRSLFPSSDFSTKKKFYLHLCDHPVLIDEGKKSFSLDKRTGKKCFMLSARDLKIIWGDTPEYWEWISIPESRFPEAAKLKAVCWLEIRGRINSRILSPNTDYTAYLVYRMSTDSYGFEFRPVEVSVGIVGSDSVQNGTLCVCLDTESQRQEFRRVDEMFRSRQIRREMMSRDDDECDAVERGDGWLEVELGDFFKGRDEGDEVEISVREVHTGCWKKGLIVEGIEIRPKHV